MFPLLTVCSGKIPRGAASSSTASLFGGAGASGAVFRRLAFRSARSVVVWRSASFLATVRTSMRLSVSDSFALGAENLSPDAHDLLGSAQYANDSQKVLLFRICSSCARTPHRLNSQIKDVEHHSEVSPKRLFLILCWLVKGGCYTSFPCVAS